MKLVIEPLPYTQKIFVITKLGRMPIREFLKLALIRSQKKYTELNADAGIDHAQHYQLMHGDKSTKHDGQSLRTTLMLLESLDYDVILKKRDRV